MAKVGTNEKAADLRAMIGYLKERDDLVVIDKEVDPHLELSGLAKALDGGPALLFTNVKGYPGKKVIANIFANRERVANLFDTESEYLAKTLAEAIKTPLPSREVQSAPCQEHVITENIDLLKLLPVPKITEEDSTLVITGGITVVKVPDADAFDLSYRRMAVDGKDWTGFACNAAGHLATLIAKAGGRCPATVCIGSSAATLLAAAGATQQTITPLGYSEAWFAGSLQGKPVEFVKAKVQEGAWSLADAEWVLEGYIEWNQRVTEGAGGEIREGYAPLMPEAGAYEGEAYTVPTFRVTAVTHRSDPIYYFPIGGANETINLMGFPAEASVYDICKRLDPRIFDTCYALPGMRGIGGVVLRVKKQVAAVRMPGWDDAVTKNLILAAFGAHMDLSWVVAVDDDVDITDANDVIWAMISRMNPKDIIVTPITTMTTLLTRASVKGLAGHKVGFDATYPRSFPDLTRFRRPNFPECDLDKWVSAEDLAKIRAKQGDYAKSLARRRR